jgi:hypothetical protein
MSQAYSGQHEEGNKTGRSIAYDRGSCQSSRRAANPGSDLLVGYSSLSACHSPWNVYPTPSRS